MTHPVRSTRLAGRRRKVCLRLAVSLWPLLLLLAGLPAAAGEQEPVLRENITVHSDIVTLGDLFENAGAIAAIPVFRSPDPGEDGIVTSHRIAAAAHQHGLIWTNPGDIDKVVISRPSRMVKADDFAKLVRARIAADLGIEDDSALDVELSRNFAPVHLDPRNTSPLAVESLDYSNTTGSFRARIGFTAASDNQPTIVIHGRATEMLELPVPARPIDREQEIAAEDIKLIRIAKSRVGRGTVLTRDDIVGMAAKRRLAANRPVPRADLDAPKIIKRNTVVEIQFEQGGLFLKADGRALSDAAKGEAVKVLNTQTKRTVEGTAITAGVVSVTARTASVTPIKRTYLTSRITRVHAKKPPRFSAWETSVVKAN